MCGSVKTGRNKGRQNALVSSRKVEEILELIRVHSVTLIIFQSAISPIQERNLERELNCRVIDRVRLILDIFALRARSREGKLQVELAQLRHLSTRLVRSWKHLERQKGGIGLRGPGETQLETDRRLIGKRIRTLDKRLDRVRSQRELQRRRRRRRLIPTISLVGYTNAGKSSLFNQLTDGNVYVADQPFATLDPTIRKTVVPGYGTVLFSDTVGFIRELPVSLVKAFRATLEEVVTSQLLIHVVDFSIDDYQERIYEVESVLSQIGALNIPRLTVFNKIDLVGSRPRLIRDDNGLPIKLWLSAKTSVGNGELCQAIAEHLNVNRKTRQLRLAAANGRCRAKIHEWAEVRKEELEETGHWILEIVIDDAIEGRLNSMQEFQEDFAWMD